MGFLRSSFIVGRFSISQDGSITTRCDPSTAPLVAAFKMSSAPYEVNNKGTIRFPLSKPVPVKLIAALARFRAKEVAANVASEGGQP